MGKKKANGEGSITKRKDGRISKNLCIITHSLLQI